jgi:hypothetical protein
MAGAVMPADEPLAESALVIASDDGTARLEQARRDAWVSASVADLCSGLVAPGRKYPDPPGPGASTIHPKGGIGGAQAGYNWQSGNVVYGLTVGGGAVMASDVGKIAQAATRVTEARQFVFDQKSRIAQQRVAGLDTHDAEFSYSTNLKHQNGHHPVICHGLLVVAVAAALVGAAVGIQQLVEAASVILAICATILIVVIGVEALRGR